MQPTTLIPGETQADAVSDRRADIDAKMARVRDLLLEVGCEGLLLLDPANFAWLTSGAMSRGLGDPAAEPAAYSNGEHRWIIASNVDSQRLFDEEVDGLGFQLKEWPWHWGRDQFLADLCQNRKVACDRPVHGVVNVAEPLRLLRRRLTIYEQACQLAVGQTVAHALEATCRTLSPGESEREIAGHLSHRLLHRGILPLHIGVAVDGRSRLYRRFGFTSSTLERYAVLTVTARKYGVYVTASRSVCFGEVPPEFRQDHNAVCRVSASYLASTWPDAVPREILLAGRRIYLISGYEHEWQLTPQGHLTGRAAIELPLTPQTEDLFQSDWCVTWNASAGAACSCDTFLITEQGPKIVTPTEVWPLKRIRIQGAEFVRPDVLQR
ncbi:MAG TPA: M24 family metallopeptidase [Gemmataceae bacterium]|nr:M24 family metallopeptidase [Gemmataceae bacterium]